jgi:hypothetical protein
MLSLLFHHHHSLKKFTTNPFQQVALPLVLHSLWVTVLVAKNYVVLCSFFFTWKL